MLLALDSGNTAWVLISAALVLFMTPGLAFFYGGMVRSKNVLGMLMQNMFAIGLVSTIWAVVGFSLVFGDSGNGWIGNFDFLFLTDVTNLDGDIPGMAFVAFQMMFAVITPALITGATADRLKFGSYAVLIGFWSLLVYIPGAKWVFNGWLLEMGALDFAGGTAIHISAGVAALAVVLVIGNRKGHGDVPMPPHNLPFTVLGTGILWFGWFGFNVGAEFLNGMQNVGLITVNTLGATAAAILGWLVIEKVKEGKATSIGAASGAVSGLVAITPACANVTPVFALLLGVLAGVLSALAVDLKYKFGYDDSLDVVGIHLVSGLVGTLYLGFFAIDTGLFTGGDIGQLVVQAIAAFGVLAYSFVLALVIGFAIEKTVGFRVKSEDEIAGVDSVVHGEAAYSFGQDAEVK